MDHDVPAVLRQLKRNTAPNQQPKRFGYSGGSPIGQVDHGLTIHPSAVRPGDAVLVRQAFVGMQRYLYKDA